MPSTLGETKTQSAAPAGAWDSEVFVLRADDREKLRERVQAVAGAVAQQPHLTELAASLAAEMLPGGSRISFVASTHEDLLKKLNRAAERLADPKCKHIRDAGGIYYFSDPLAEHGTVALLFPGEGAQYLNMLADLCSAFPVVEATFAWCDQLAMDAGRPESSMRRMLHLPPNASAEEKAAAEAVLRGLGPSIFGVLVADKAIYRILELLQIPVAAMAGHSAGELGALLASGAMQSQDQHGSRLPEIMGIMQQQEDEASGPDVALLAVGASKATIGEVAAEVAGGEVVVAMDNCPHQCVAVGPSNLIAAVEAELTERGIICERLPFKRPYHTSLFEPYMGAFRELFANVPFSESRTPVYCCSTGELFPTDPEAMRDLAVNHWVRPVEFTRMIERMHEDGVRLFVECGPRGNLSAFVEDILRGKSFAAIPANVPRKSGPTQINHMVAQLVSHSVNLNLSALYEGRVHIAESAKVPPPVEANGELSYHARQAITNYLDVMEQFLDTQREVMTAFLGSRTSSAAALPAEMLAAFDLAVPAAETPQTHIKPFALAESIVAFEPGRQVVFRRVMDEREDLYADYHTLGGRGVSREDPSQNGLPILPMTFSLEAMSEAASLLMPGKVVIAIRNVKMLRWLPFDPNPTTLEVRAAVAAVDPDSGIVEVKADVRDLGNSFLRDAANRAACEAVIVLADAYPEPPTPQPFALTDEVPCQSTVEDLCRNMFHGELFQMITSLGRTGREGIEGTLEVKRRDTWFRSNPDPVIAIDPVLTDAAMHILGAWHLEQPDWSGRILLPIGVNSVEFFGPPPPVGARFIVRGHNEEETARQVRHGVEAIDDSGRVWLRLTGASYWRFYLPFGHVNFFGPKDQYFLSRDWPEAALGYAPETFARCHYLEPPADLKQPVLRASGARVTMTAREIDLFTNWTGTDAELNDWFFGRMLAKDPVRAIWHQKHGEAMYPADIETDEENGRIICKPRGAAKAAPLPPVRVAIADGKLAAFSAFADRLGIGLVAIAKNAAAEVERDARANAALNAVADALKISPDHCTMHSLDMTSGTAIVQAESQRFRVQTARQKEAVVATTLCEAL